MADILPKVAEIFDDANTEPERDAIHFAVVKVRAQHALKPGQRVGLTNPVDKSWVGVAPSNLKIGIVSPFLPRDVKKGEWFYLFLDSGTVANLRHTWVHHSFDEGVPENPAPASVTMAAVAYLRDVADENGVSYGRLMDALDNEDTIHLDRDINDYDLKKVWESWEIVRGKARPASWDDLYLFSCSC